MKASDAPVWKRSERPVCHDSTFTVGGNVVDAKVIPTGVQGGGATWSLYDSRGRLFASGWANGVHSAKVAAMAWLVAMPPSAFDRLVRG